nr:MAG TPA: hypothetical protein [Caudoviricetes sp.]
MSLLILRLVSSPSTCIIQLIFYHNTHMIIQ